MNIAPLAEVKERFSSYIDASQECPVIVTRNGKPVAMIIGIHDSDDLDSLLLAHNPRFIRLLDEARERVKVNGAVPLSEFRQKLATRSNPELFSTEQP